MSIYRREVHESPASRIFLTFRRWPRVPFAELYRLLAAVNQCVDLAGSESANELLTLVTNELGRRAAEPTHLPRQNPLAVRAGHPDPSRPIDARSTPTGHDHRRVSPGNYGLPAHAHQNGVRTSVAVIEAMTAITVRDSSAAERSSRASLSPAVLTSRQGPDTPRFCSA